MNTSHFRAILGVIGAASTMQAQLQDVGGSIGTAANLMYERGVTNGCSTTAPLYCPGATLTRGDAAALIIRAIASAQSGDPESFGYTTTPYFVDVPNTDPQFKYVQAMKDMGITSGCWPADHYCVGDPVSNGDLAVFATRAHLALQSYPGFDCTPLFPYTACASRNTFPNDAGTYTGYAHDYIEYFYALNPYSHQECGDYLSYCSSQFASRGQTALNIVYGIWANVQLPSNIFIRPAATVSPADQTQLYYTAGTQQVRFTISSNLWPVALSVGHSGAGSADLYSGSVTAASPIVDVAMPQYYDWPTIYLRQLLTA